MATTTGRKVGRIATIWRYPVKSMAGEILVAADVTARGVVGDRAFALVDDETGKVASAKDPRRWPLLLQMRSSYVQPPRDDLAPGIAEVATTDGGVLRTDRDDFDARISEVVGRPVHLAKSAFAGASIDGYWPDHEWLQAPDQGFEVTLTQDGFFDGGPVHLITSATLAHLESFAPQSRFDPRRFRPNFVVAADDALPGFLEDSWIGQTLVIGDVHLRIERPCPRCVMTTVSQGDLPKDPAILRTSVTQNHGNVGVYATVLQPGRIANGDEVAVL